MAYTRTSFYYDPVRSGYDTNSWRTISGAPAVAAGTGRIVVDAGTGTDGSAIHYADFLKGDISFNVNVPSAPGGGDNRLFGVSAPNTLAYIRFSIADTFTCQTSDGVNTTNSSEITWDSNWTGANIVFRIMWEAGTAKFYVNGSQVYAVTDASVPAGPLSLYLFDNSSSAMTIGDINVRGTQSYVMNPKTSDSTSTATSGTITMTQSVTVTENVAILLPELSLPYTAGGLSESVTVSESVTMLVSSNDEISDSVTVTDVPSVSIGQYVPDVFDEVTVTEDLSVYQGGESMFSIFEDVTITEDPVVSI